MQYLFEVEEDARVTAARESFSGRPLIDPQFDEGLAISGIIERHIHRIGAFKDPLSDYVSTFSRTWKIDPARAETILRDIFAARTGQSMNQMRAALQEREEKLTPEQKKMALDFALAVGQMIEEGDKISFHRAYAFQAQALAGELRITDAGAKRLMKEEFQAARGKDFYEWGKAIETEFYTPQIEAERQQREEKKNQRPARTYRRA